MRDHVARLLRRLACIAIACPAIRAQERAGALTVGHWVSIKGALAESGEFEADEIEAGEPSSSESLVGTVGPHATDRSIELLGFEVRLGESARRSAASIGELSGKRVKVQGLWRGERRFDAVEIQ